MTFSERRRVCFPRRMEELGLWYINSHPNLFEGKLKQRIFQAKHLKIKKRMDQFKRDVEEM